MSDLAQAIEVAALWLAQREGIALKHLPGKHDQSTHAHGGARRLGTEGGAALTEEAKTRGMGIAQDTAKELGFDPDSVVYGGPGKEFKVGGESMEAGAAFDPSDGKIYIHDGVLAQSDDAAFIKGVVAHEVNHAKFMEVHLQYDSERTSLMFNKDKLDRDGELLAKHRKEYPTYHALHKYFDGDKSDKLESEDGVTSYSRAYWKGKQKKGGKLKLAIDETLAEVSYLRIQGKGDNVSGTWVSFNDAVNSHYSRLKKKR